VHHHYKRTYSKSLIDKLHDLILIFMCHFSKKRWDLSKCSMFICVYFFHKVGKNVEPDYLYWVHCNLLVLGHKLVR